MNRLGAEYPLPPIISVRGPLCGPRLVPAQLRKGFQPQFSTARRRSGYEVKIVLCGNTSPNPPRGGSCVGDAQIRGEVSRGRPNIEDRFHTQTLRKPRSIVNAFCVIC